MTTEDGEVNTDGETEETETVEPAVSSSKVNNNNGRPLKSKRRALDKTQE